MGFFLHYDNMTDYTHHLNVHLQIPVKPEIHECKLCEKLFPEKILLEKHIQTHIGNYPIKDEVSDPMRDKVSDPMRDKVSDPMRDKVSDPIRNEISDPIRDKVSGPIRNEVSDSGDSAHQPSDFEKCLEHNLRPRLNKCKCKICDQVILDKDFFQKHLQSHNKKSPNKTHQVQAPVPVTQHAPSCVGTPKAKQHACCTKSGTFALARLLQNKVEQIFFL